MSWLGELGDELRAAGVSGAERRRILAELHDHIASEPGCEDRLGDPRELAVQFADELATDRSRRSAYSVFVALAATAVALFVSQAAIAAARGYPGYDRGLSLALFIPAALGMVVAPQAALVAGTLAAWRAMRRRQARVLPTAELELIRRRAWVGLGSGIATAVGLELYVIDFSRVLPGWWLALVGALAAVAGAALVGAAIGLRRAGAVRASTDGPAGDVFDDLPLIGWGCLRRRPWLLGVAASLIAGAAITAITWHAESSLIEGAQRGAFEAAAAALGFAIFGRAIGVRTRAAGD